MNLHALRVFHTVAKLGGFSLAAEALFISQPAVSKALKELENQLNIQLIERGAKGKKLMLTEGGQVLYDHARSIFAIEKSAIDDIKLRTDLKRGSLIIGTSTTIAGYWLPDYLAKFCAIYPDIKIEVKVANTAKIEQELLDCAIDLALVEGEPTEPEITCEHWQNDILSIVMSSSMEPTINIHTWLSDQHWLLREPGSGTLEISKELFKQQNIKIEKSMQLGSNEAIARAVSQGLGVALLPNVVTEELVQLGKLKRLEPQYNEKISRSLYQLKYKNRPSSHAANAFEAILFTV